MPENGIVNSPILRETHQVSVTTSPEINLFGATDVKYGMSACICQVMYDRKSSLDSVRKGASVGLCNICHKFFAQKY